MASISLSQRTPSTDDAAYGTIPVLARLPDVAAGGVSDGAAIAEGTTPCDELPATEPQQHLREGEAQGHLREGEAPSEPPQELGHAKNPNNDSPENSRPTVAIPGSRWRQPPYVLGAIGAVFMVLIAVLLIGRPNKPSESAAQSAEAAVNPTPTAGFPSPIETHASSATPIAPAQMPTPAAQLQPPGTQAVSVVQPTTPPGPPGVPGVARLTGTIESVHLQAHTQPVSTKGR